MNILVTGGTGYIGAHTAVELITAGHHPILVDNLSNSHLEMVSGLEAITGKSIEFHCIDLCDRSKTFDLMRRLKVDAIIHFAAFKAVGESVIDPQKYYRNNIGSMVNVLDAAIDCGVKHFIFSSSCTVYGETNSLPVTEGLPFGKATSPYGVTKQTGESMLQDACKAYGMNGISLRYFNPAGAHESALIGEYPLQAPSNLVPILTRAAILEQAVKVFGNDYPTRDGTCVRDYIHVVDVARAHVNAVERCLSGVQRERYEIFNLGSGSGNTVLEVIRSFEQASGKTLKVTMAPRRTGDVAMIWASTAMAEKELKWRTHYSLEDIVQSAWKWELHLQTILAD